MDTIIERFKRRLDEYWLFAATQYELRDIQAGVAQNAVKYVLVGATLAKTPGVLNYDYSSLRINGGTADIPIGLGEFPVTAGVNLNA